MNLQFKLKIININIMLATTLGGLFFASGNSFAADWTSIKKSKDYELLVDMDSYNETDGLPLITAKYVFNKPKNPVIDSTKIGLNEEHVTTQFNCKLQLYKTLATHYFKRKGELLETKNGEGSFNPIKKESDNAIIASLVCQVHQMLGGS